MVKKFDTSEGLGKERVASLSDGIFAFAMTLLVLDLKIEKVPDELMLGMIAGLWPKFLAYVTSFFVLGLYWVAHHGYAHFLKRTDRWFLWLNLLFLMVVVLIPFSTDLLGDHPADTWAVVIYGCNIQALGATLYAQWWYATRCRHLVGNLEPELVRAGKLRILRGIILFTIAIFVAFMSPTLSLVMYTLILIGYLFPGHLDHHWTHSHS